MKHALFIAVTFVVAGCAAITEPFGMADPFAIPQPFQGVERNDSMLAQAIEAPALVVEPPEGLNAEFAAALRDRVVQAARGHDVPALAEPAPRAWVLRASSATIASTAEGVQRVHVVSWRLVDALGKERARFPVRFVGPETALTQAAVQLLAEQTASALEAALTRPGTQVAARQADALSPVAWIGAIKGAPGDGNAALARALQGVLPLKGVRVEAKKDKAAWSIEGRVKVAPKSPSEDVVTLTWRVLDAKGKEAGAVTQENVVARGRLQKPWAEVAGFAAEAAAEGIAQLLQQVAQTQAG